MAAVLWGSGVSFGGVLAFLYADLIVLPLLDVYRAACESLEGEGALF
jgi:hypothetical protein